MSGDIRIRQIESVALEAALPGLAEILQDCVRHGASVGFMATNTPADYAAYWRAVAAEVDAGRILLFVAETEDGIVGTAQLHPIAKPNQPHRAEIAKVLVHSKARRRGIGKR